MNSGTKFAIGIIIMMMATVLLFFAFNNTGVTSPGTFLQSFQQAIGGGPGVTESNNAPTGNAPVGG